MMLSWDMFKWGKRCLFLMLLVLNNVTQSRSSVFLMLKEFDDPPIHRLELPHVWAASPEFQRWQGNPRHSAPHCFATASTPKQ